MGQAKAAQKAAKIQSDSAKYATDTAMQSAREQRELSEKIYNQNVGYIKDQENYNRGINKGNADLYNPYVQAGQHGLQRLNNYRTPEFKMEQDPGFQFRQEQGQRALENTQAARGDFLSGRGVKEAMDFNSGLASQESQNAFQRYKILENQDYSRLMDLVNTGVIGNAGYANSMKGTTIGTDLANLGSNYATNENTNTGNLNNSLININSTDARNRLATLANQPSTMQQVGGALQLYNSARGAFGGSGGGGGGSGQGGGLSFFGGQGQGGQQASGGGSQVTGALTGAASGAATGFAVGGPYGALVGGVIGGAASLF